jgi:hypothetical protein
MNFPTDNYTPHGYLDNRGHCHALNPSGVLRSFDVGFQWHVPAYDGRANLDRHTPGSGIGAGFAGSFGARTERYVAGFRVGLGDAWSIPDFDEVSCPYHSSRVVEFQVRNKGSAARLTFHLVDEHALRARIRADGPTPPAIEVQHLRRLCTDGSRAEDGLVGRVDGDVFLLQTFPEGEVFAIGVSPRWRLSDLAGVPADLAHDRGESSTVPGSPGDLIGLRARLAAPGGNIEVVMARGGSPAAARRRLESATADGASALVSLRAADDAFWERAPRLSGDWPAHWRRGLVYDLETVRMVVRDPVGIYDTPWDGMQIQAPRTVLAEAAMDAVVLSYADPQLAQHMFLGTFADAPEPNVPCTREDGSYNMINADGTASGTAPSWGLPFRVAELLAAARPDRDWLDSLYPHLGAYLRWWLQHRRDDDGFLSYASTWESGQDSSPRFGPQPLGPGSPVRHVRAVDLQAAAAHAALVMGRFAGTLGRHQDVDEWRRVADEFRCRTVRLWNGERFADLDARTGRLTDVQDVMLAVPLAVGVADRAQRTAAMPWLLRTVRGDGYEGRTDLGGALLAWPMFAWTAVEACLAVGAASTAAEITHQVVDRAYTFWDERQNVPRRTLPGIACEYWPEHGACGTEGYGWGAFGSHLLLRAIVGLSPYPRGFLLRPNLPQSWRGRYELRLWVGERPRQIALTTTEDGTVEVGIDGTNLTLGPGEQADVPTDSSIRRC